MLLVGRKSAQSVLTIWDAETKIDSSACLNDSTNMAQSLIVVENVPHLAWDLAAVKTKIGSRAYLEGSTNNAQSLTVAEKVLLPWGRKSAQNGVLTISDAIPRSARARTSRAPRTWRSRLLWQ